MAEVAASRQNVINFVAFKPISDTTLSILGSGLNLDIHGHRIISNSIDKPYINLRVVDRRILK